MRSTQQFSITLPHEMAEAVRAKVAAGEYATDSEVIRDGLRALLARDRAVEDWLRKDVAAAYDKLKASPSRAVGVGSVKARLAAAHAKAAKKAAAPLIEEWAKAVGDDARQILANYDKLTKAK